MDFIASSNRYTCNRKLKLTMEEAAEKFGRKSKEMTLYICTHCHYLHYGHPFGYHKNKPRSSNTPIADMLERQRSRFYHLKRKGIVI